MSALLLMLHAATFLSIRLLICRNCSRVSSTLLLDANGYHLCWYCQNRSFNVDERQTLRTFKLFWRLYTTALSRALSSQCRQCPHIFQSRSAEPWRACISSTLQVMNRPACLCDAGQLRALCLCCAAQCPCEQIGTVS